MIKKERRWRFRISGIFRNPYAQLAAHAEEFFFAAGGIEHFETVRVTKDGRLLDISLTISPLAWEGTDMELQPDRSNHG